MAAYRPEHASEFEAGDEEEPLVPGRADAGGRRSPTLRVVIAIACCLLAALLVGLATWNTSRGQCSKRRAFAYATMMTRNVGASNVSLCYRAAVAIMLRTWLATHSRYPLLLLHTADLDPGMQNIIDERPGAVLAIRTEQLEQPGASGGDLGAMATKLNLWTLGLPYEQIAYYDADHVFASNADALFDACGCRQPFCGVWDTRMKPHNFLRSFGQPSSGNYTRRLVNAGMMVIQPSRDYGAFLRTQWARRAEFMTEDRQMVATGSDQTFFNHMMGASFRIVDEGYNLLHLDRTSLHTPEGRMFKRYLTLNGTAMDPAIPTVAHLKAWTRGTGRPGQAVNKALRERIIDRDPYISSLLRGRFCARDNKRLVMKPPQPLPLPWPRRQ